MEKGLYRYLASRLPYNTTPTRAWVISMHRARRAVVAGG